MPRFLRAPSSPGGEGAPGEIPHPHAERPGGDREHPRPTAFQRGEDPDREERSGEHREQDPERAPMHERERNGATIALAAQRTDSGE